MVNRRDGWKYLSPESVKSELFMRNKSGIYRENLQEHSPQRAQRSQRKPMIHPPPDLSPCGKGFLRNRRIKLWMRRSKLAFIFSSKT
jgi:hypothetical protein